MPGCGELPAFGCLPDAAAHAHSSSHGGLNQQLGLHRPQLLTSHAAAGAHQALRPHSGRRRRSMGDCQSLQPLTRRRRSAPSQLLMRCWLLALLPVSVLPTGAAAGMYDTVHVLGVTASAAVVETTAASASVAGVAVEGSLLQAAGSSMLASGACGDTGCGGVGELFEEAAAGEQASVAGHVISGTEVLSGQGGEGSQKADGAIASADGSQRKAAASPTSSGQSSSRKKAPKELETESSVWRGMVLETLICSVVFALVRKCFKSA
eukprot:TRINITY_DN94046_c0_g1_i1.p1 TRINITY_DN94046_c0_g1~~TRINITY_DN94046_c0_g1_i1.p1  ORF type:complete len:265 (-),score=62.73 TRINITY_DN94046_c0_g1_i1:185-979(-)